MNIEEAITLWKKLKIASCTMEFSCGGDSMNDWSFAFYGEKGGSIESVELKDFFDAEVFEKVEFYVNSDGHYVGEAGTVEIALNHEGDAFDYTKDAESEYDEQHTEITDIALPENMVKFIEENVSNINGGENDVTINFKRDFILTDEREVLMKKLEEKLKEEVNDFMPDQEINGDLKDWRTFTTNDDSEELETLTITGNSLKMVVTVTYTYYTTSE
jgi:hypothetical protein